MKTARNPKSVWPGNRSPGPGPGAGDRGPGARGWGLGPGDPQGLGPGSQAGVKDFGPTGLCSSTREHYLTQDRRSPYEHKPGNPPGKGTENHRPGPAIMLLTAGGMWECPNSFDQGRQRSWGPTIGQGGVLYTPGCFTPGPGPQAAGPDPGPRARTRGPDPGPKAPGPGPKPGARAPAPGRARGLGFEEIS